MQDESAAGATMINTGAGGVKIGSNDPRLAEIVAAEITDEDEKRGVLAFLKN